MHAFKYLFDTIHKKLTPDETMTDFTLHLSTHPAPAPYASTALFSITQECIHIHQNRAQPLRSIKMAARQVASLISGHVVFDDSWDHVAQRVFVQSLGKPNLRVTWSNHVDATALDQEITALRFAQQLVNDTPENLSPEQLAKRVAHYLEGLAPDAVSAKHIVGEALLDFGWVGIHGVGRGSVRPPVLLELDYNPTGQADAPVSTALVGKGITFDSGGYSIKSSEGMLDMKCDMGGAATVAAAMGLAIMQNSQKRIKLFLCCAENLISGHAYKLGDVLTYKNGTTVEIVNTDAEGRLVLADGLQAASESHPQQIIDAATLTGAAMMAVGTDYNALFSQYDEHAQRLTALGETFAEPYWRLPLADFHVEACPSPFADTANSRPQKGGGAGGASNAAGFLQRFVTPGIPWLHIDLAAAYTRNANAMQPAGATAMGVLSIAEFIK
jgi:PepB aminopeptidase